MKNRFIITLLCAATTACAENLPPVVSTVAPPEVNKPAGPSVSTVNEMMNRIEQMQKEIQQLTGKVEDQVFLIAELKKQQKTMYTDFDERLTALESKAGVTAAPSADITDTSTPDSEAAKPDAETKSTETATTDSTTTDVAVPAASNESDDSATTPKAKPEPQPETPIEASAEEKQEYQAAYNQLRTGHTDESITAFDAYLLKYPNGGYASNVQYWLGEAYRVKQDNEAAKAAFNKVVDNYPSSTKVPDALLKLGYIEVEQNNPSKATDYFNRIITDYPSSNAAYLASKKLASLADKAAP